MAHTIFFSWQSDRLPLIGRNFIERALKEAVKRVSTDTTVENAPRGELLIDRDTLNVPGSPPIFPTILAKIEQAVIFVPDLTFVGTRDDGTPMPNPNVLIEYGYALNQHGHPRIIGVMNAAYGEPKPENMPFNLGHIKFPIRYLLHEDADEDQRKTARAALSKEFEAAIKMVFASEGFKSSTEVKAPAPPRTVLDEAEEYANEFEYENALKLLGYGPGLDSVRANVSKLFARIKEQCAEVRNRGHIDLEAAANPWEERGVYNSCAVRGRGFSMRVEWRQPFAGSDRDAALTVAQFQVEVLFPNELGLKMHLDEPRKLGMKTFLPHLSRYSEVGWGQKAANMKEATFISNEELADTSLTEFIRLLRGGSR